MSDIPQPPKAPSKFNAAAIERALQITGWLVIALASLAGLVVFVRPHRFDADIPDGATANAIESLEISISVWLFIFGGAALVIYSKLCQIARRLKRR